MNRITTFIIVIMVLIITGCNNKHKLNSGGGSVEIEAIADSSDASATSNDDKNIYNSKSGYIKYNSTIGVIREIWFDNFGALQHEESYKMKDGKKLGTSSWVIEGVKYDMQIGGNQMVKMPYKPEPATEYEHLSAEVKEQYGVKKIGDESVLGKYCTVVSFEKPMPSTVWLYKGIPLKSVSSSGGDDVTIIAVDFNENPVDSAIFILPDGVQIISL